MPRPRASSRPAMSASRSACSEAPASWIAITSTAKTTSSTQLPATAREVDSRLSSPMRGARRPPRARWVRAAAVSRAAVTSAATRPAVRAVVQPLPMAVNASASVSTITPPHTTNSVERHTMASHASPASRLRSATARADWVSSSDTHWREAPAEWATAAGRPSPAARPSRLARKAATARRCPSRAPCGQSPHVQPPLCVLCRASCTATEVAALSNPPKGTSLRRRGILPYGGGSPLHP